MCALPSFLAPGPTFSGSDFVTFWVFFVPLRISPTLLPSFLPSFHSILQQVSTAQAPLPTLLPIPSPSTHTNTLPPLPSLQFSICARMYTPPSAQAQAQMPPPPPTEPAPPSSKPKPSSSPADLDPIQPFFGVRLGEPEPSPPTRAGVLLVARPVPICPVSCTRRGLSRCSFEPGRRASRCLSSFL